MTYSRLARKISKDKYLSEREQARLLACLTKTKYSNPRDYMLIVTMLNTGLRTFEAAALRKSDVDFGESLLVVRHGKGDKYREVSLGSRFAANLLEYCKDMREDAWLFPGTKGKGLTTRHVRRIFKEYIVRAGINPVISAHACRHTRGIALYESSKDLVWTAQELGHADVATTMVYMHVSPERRKELAEKTREVC